MRFLITATFRQLTRQGGARGEFVTGDPAHQRNFSKEKIKDSSRNRDSQNVSSGGFELRRHDHQSSALTTKPVIAAAKDGKSLLFIR